MEGNKTLLDTGMMYENKFPELKKEERYTSPASSLPLHELKMLQNYIHGANLQNLSATLPNNKKQLILINFFRAKRNQLVEVYSRNGEEVIHTRGKVNVIGRNFVMLKTLFTRTWIPYQAIHSAKTPFNTPDVPDTHQHVAIDEELRRKLLTNFGETVAGKETLRQKFYEESLETNLKTWKGTKLTIHADQEVTAKLLKVTRKNIYIKNQKEKALKISTINYIKQWRFLSFFQRFFHSLAKNK
ncbi:hypothetical protein D8M04_13155 [Oceanobacillus piezotolerans]|uniref:Uncharacterized protein n=1 Tax=Oceanobacillus piezotolerans TaxID=2448030 RepID=A0A498DCI1_9BACI|nr:hypothetical protein [Oceanobacillus piezotolerans]RLL43851.1 hypothetical protein D8M04_13155 [Oceanobacillus piezotolerans]